MLRLPAPRLPPEFFPYSFVAVGAAGVAYSAWIGIELGAKTLLAMLTTSLVLLLVGLLQVWFVPLLDDAPQPSLRRLLLSRDRLKRLHKALEFLPGTTAVRLEPAALAYGHGALAILHE